MEYSFSIIDYFDDRDGQNKQAPNLNIPNYEQYGEYFLDEITNISGEYLEEIITKLRKIIKGEIKTYEFGYEVYNFDCDMKECLVLNTFEDWKEEAVIPTVEIFEMLKDWKQFLDENIENKSQS